MKTKIFLILILLTALLSGCLGTREAASEITYPDTGIPGEAPLLIEKGGFEATEEMVAPAPGTTSVTGETIERKIIKTAYLSIEVDDFDVAAGKVEALVQASDGFISDSNSFVTDTGQKRGRITIRVPEEGFLDVMKELEKLGDVKSTSTSGQDVTEEYVDLDARLRTREKEEERLLEILENATTVEDILKVEEHLTRVREEIERITGRLRYLDNLASLSTITVELFEPEPITRSLGLREALVNSVEGFIDTTKGLIVFAGSILPLAIALLFVYVIIRRLRRKKPEKTEE